MPYGTIKVDNVTFTNAGSDQTISVSGIVASISGNITATGTISGNIIRGGTTVSGATVTGTAGQFGTITGNTAGFTTVTGTTVTGTTATFTSGVFTNISGGTCTLTSGVFASGTAAAPSVSVGTTTNGLYSPGADQLAISTGGQGRLFVDASGRVGLGAGSPASLLNLAGDNTAFRGQLSIQTSSASNFSQITFYDRTTFGAQIYQGYGSSNELVIQNVLNGPLTFGTNNTERLRITSTGTVNIVGAGSAGVTQAVSFNGSAPVNSLVVDSSGRVGVGASLPNTRLHVADGEFTISTGGNVADAGGVINFGISQLYTYSPMATIQGLLANSAGTELQGGLGFFTRPSGAAGQSLQRRMTITSAGLVGIGTSSPATALDVVGEINATTGFASNRFGVNKTPLSTTTTAQSYAWFKTTGGDFYIGTESSTAGGFFTGSTAYAACLYNNAATPIQFFTGGAVRATLNSTGLGIGTNGPNTTLEIQNSSTPRIRIGDGVRHFEIHGGSSTQNVALGTAYNSGFDFFINGFNNPKMTLDASGRLLVGTSSARTKWFNLTLAGPLIQAESGSNQMGVSSTYTANDASGPIIALGKTRGSLYEVVSSGDDVGVITFQGGDGSEMVEAARITAQVDGTPGANDMPGRLVFSTTADGASSPTERMRIRNTGSTGIFHTASGAGGAVLELNSSATAGTTDYIFWATNSATGTFTGTVCLRAFTNGNVQNTNNSYGAISDAKLKENIVDASSQWSDIKALQVRKYNFKEGQTHTQIGLVAQEVELVSPGLVSESPDRDAEGNDLGTVTKSVNYSVLYMKAVKALQEAMERIEQLEAEMAAVKAQLS